MGFSSLIKIEQQNILFHLSYQCTSKISRDEYCSIDLEKLPCTYFEILKNFPILKKHRLVKQGEGVRLLSIAGVKIVQFNHPCIPPPHPMKIIFCPCREERSWGGGWLPLSKFIWVCNLIKCVFLRFFLVFSLFC